MEPTKIKLEIEEVAPGEYEVTSTIDLVTRKHTYKNCRNDIFPLVKALITTLRELKNETVIIQTHNSSFANVIRLAGKDTRTLSKMLNEAIHKNGITVAGVEITE